MLPARVTGAVNICAGRTRRKQTDFPYLWALAASRPQLHGFSIPSAPSWGSALARAPTAAPWGAGAAGRQEAKSQDENVGPEAECESRDVQEQVE